MSLHQADAPALSLPAHAQAASARIEYRGEVRVVVGATLTGALALPGLVQALAGTPTLRLPVQLDVRLRRVSGTVREGVGVVWIGLWHRS